MRREALRQRHALARCAQARALLGALTSAPRRRARADRRQACIAVPASSYAGPSRNDRSVPVRRAPRPTNSRPRILGGDDDCRECRRSATGCRSSGRIGDDGRRADASAACASRPASCAPPTSMVAVIAVHSDADAAAEPVAKAHELGDVEHVSGRANRFLRRADLAHVARRAARRCGRRATAPLPGRG